MKGRISYPKTHADQQKLVNKISAKHTADGADSILTAFLAEQDIDLDQMVAAGPASDSIKTLHGDKMREAEDLSDLRDDTFNPVFKKFKGVVQFLKGFYRGRVSQLGYWGITVNGERIVYPKEFINKKILVKTFYEHHISLDAGSPLVAYLSSKNIIPGDEITAADDAETTHDQLSEAENEAEARREAFENLWNPVMANVRAIGNFLKRYHTNNPQRLWLWGFEVDQSPQAPRLRATKLPLGQQITVAAIKIGSVFTNTGTIPLFVHRGKDTSEPATEVPAGGQMGMLRGFSTITVVNPNTLQEGAFTVMTTKTS